MSIYFSVTKHLVQCELKQNGDSKILLGISQVSKTLTKPS